MSLRRILLLVGSAGILLIAGLGMVSVTGFAGTCGIGARGDEGNKGNNPPACCPSGDKGEEEGNPGNHERVVNAACPIMREEIDEEKLTEELLVEHRGHTVGLCCHSCPEPWEELSDEEKDEKLAESVELMWHSSPENALAEAETEGRLVVAEFHAEWCGWCQKWEAETLPDRDVQLRLLDFSLLKIDTDDQPEVAQEYGVTGLPTTVVLDSKGEVVLRHSGFNDADQYLALLAEAEMEAGVARPVNKKCPIMTGSELDKDEVTADLLKEHRGQIVGFCCPSCIDAWEALSDEEKDEKLRETL